MPAEPDLAPDPPASHRRGRRGRRLAATVVVASLAVLGACSDDEPSEGTEPADQSPTPAQQPEGDDDPTLSGDDTPGVGEAESGGTGSGSPDSGTQDGTADEDSPTAGE